MFNDNKIIWSFTHLRFFPVEKTFQKILNKKVNKIKQNESEL